MMTVTYGVASTLATHFAPCSMRRTRKSLEQQVNEARGRKDKALAYYRLGVFHDNNSREADAIPCYRRALSLGLDEGIRAQAFAWLASSLYKTGQHAEALKCIGKSERIADVRMKRFLAGLKRRIDRGIDRQFR